MVSHIQPIKNWNINTDTKNIQTYTSSIIHEQHADTTSTWTHTHLGITLDENCNWSTHIQNILTKTWKRLNILQSLTFKLDSKILECMYFSYIRPLLEYSDTVWGNCNQRDTQLLEKMQTEAGIVVTGATKTASASHILRETGWETLAHRRYTHIMITKHKIHNYTAPSYLSDLLPAQTWQTQQHYLRSNHNILPPKR